MGSSQMTFIQLIRDKHFTQEQALSALSERRLVTFVNPYSYLMLKSRIDHGLNFFDYIGVDGQSLLPFISARGGRFCRTSFDYGSIAGMIFDAASKLNKSVALIGSDEQSITIAVQRIRARHHGINIVYFRNGYFNGDAERFDAFKEISQKNIDLVVCGMGVFNQEKFLIDCRAQGWDGAGFTCGGFFHQIAKADGDYYPKLINDFNLRAIYRMYDEPKLIKRYAVDYPRAYFRLIIDACVSGRRLSK